MRHRRKTGTVQNRFWVPFHFLGTVLNRSGANGQILRTNLGTILNRLFKKKKKN